MKESVRSVVKDVKQRGSSMDGANVHVAHTQMLRVCVCACFFPHFMCFFVVKLAIADAMPSHANPCIAFSAGSDDLT